MNTLIDSLELFKWTAKKLPIRFFGDEVLRQTCEPVKGREIGSPEIKQLIKSLTDTLAQYRRHTGMGRGLAANQIGHAKRIIVVWLGDEPSVFINPKLASSEGMGSYRESCISSGTLLIGEVHRPWTGVFEYQDTNGQRHRLQADEKQTRILLHEIDHLDGITCNEKYQPGTLRFIHGGKTEIMGYELKELAS